MKEPTAEQVKRFWERCGWYFNGAFWFSPYPAEHSQKDLPPIDLNNLFKYAVPKLTPEQKARMPGFFDHDNNFTFHYLENPALSLFWAIYKALEVE